MTNSTINIAYGDDRGFSGSPGLDQEMGDAVKAMIAWCEAQGGINGRKIVGDYYDAAVTNVGSVMSQACKTDFMLLELRSSMKVLVPQFGSSSVWLVRVARRERLRLSTDDRDPRALSPVIHGTRPAPTR